MEVMNWMENNWMVLIFVIAVLAALAYGLTTNSIKKWLRYAVTVAEEELGSGTGQLKLHQVYDMLVANYPIVGKLIPFSVFSNWVDEALDWMREQLDKNPNVKQIVEGEK